MSELSPDAQTLIERGRRLDAPAEDDKDRVRRRLTAELGAGAFVATAALAGATAPSVVAASLRHPPGASARALHLLGKHGPLKLLAVVGGAAVMSVGALYVGISDERARPTPPAREGAPLQGPAEPESERANVPIEPPPVVPELAPLPEPGAPQVPAQRASRERTRRRAVVAGADETASSTLRAELALLARAQRALRDEQPALALELAHEHAGRFPRGTLDQERSGIEALAYCQLGQPAHPAVAGFLARVPSSPMALRVRRACEAP